MSKFRLYPHNLIRPLPSRRGVFLYALGVFSSLSFAQTPEALEFPLPLRLDDQLQVRSSLSDDKSVTFTSSQSLEGRNDRTMNFIGQAEIRRNGTVVKGDRITYDPDTDTAEVDGNARFIKNGMLFAGPKANLKLDAQEGWMDKPNFELKDTHGFGKAKRVDFLGDDRILLAEPVYSTCSPDNLDWYFTSNNLDIDREKKEGTGTDGVLHFFDVPLFYTPYFSLPMSAERRSGFLAPTLGLNSNNGIDITLPYYFNIAPNRDLTLYPRYLSKRGDQLGADFRYLEPQYSGEFMAEYLPNDLVTQTDRWAYSWHHQQSLAPGLAAYANINRVSDDLYANDLGRSNGQVIAQQFNQEVGLNYAADGWNFLSRVQKYQTLQPDITALVPVPYDREPELNARYRNLNWNGAIVNFESDFTRFAVSPNTPLALMPANGLNKAYFSAERTYVSSSIAFPYKAPGYFLTPKVSFRANNYNLDSSDLSPGASVNFTVPTASLDSGLYFERDATELSGIFGREMLLTLEPRLLYVYTPYRDQTQVPLFDTALSGFGISQIFSENSFVGNDRFSDNNKVTIGVTSRLLDSDTGTERVRGIIAQRLDLSGQRVGLNGDQATVQRASDLLVGASTRLVGNLNLDIADDYNYDLNRSVQTTATASWRPSAHRMVNLSYRYTFDPTITDPTIPNTTVNQYEISGQWPVMKNLSAIGRWNYDRVTEKTLNTLAGFEYDQECWAARVAIQRFVNTSLETTTQIFFQLEFKGLTGVGNNPIDIMKFNIPGYMPTNQSPTPVSRFEQYE